MTIVLLVRHAETEFVRLGRLAGRMPGVPLNERGRTQATALAERLAALPIKAVYSSPLERATETARAVAGPHELEVVVREALLETDVGEWQGRSLKELARLKEWKALQRTPSRMRFPGGESVPETQFRMCREIEAVCVRHDAKDTIVCVSHGDPIRLAVAHYVGLPLDLFQRLDVVPASVTAVSLGENGIRLLALNWQGTLSLPKP